MKKSIINVIKDKMGFTLLELIVVIAILSIVILAISSLHMFGIRFFNNGASQVDVQSEVRLVNEFIISELRYAKDVTLDTPTSAVINNYNMIQYDSMSKSIKYKSAGGTLIDKTRVLIETTGNMFNVSNVSTPCMLSFDMDGSYKKAQFNLSNEFELQNVKKIVGTTSGNTIYYKSASSIAMPISGTGIPAINLSTPYDHIQGMAYNKLDGVHVLDSFGNEVTLTATVSINPNIDASTPVGTYYINYTATYDGKTVNKDRTVNVIAQVYTLTELVEDYTYEIINPTTTQPTIKITPTSKSLDSATISVAGGSNSGASITYDNNTKLGTVTRVNNQDRSVAITITATRAGEPSVVRTLTFSVPNKSTNVAVTISNDITY